MTTDTILMNNFLTSLVNENDLRFEAQGKHGGMTHSILGFKKIFIENIVVWNMAIVAIGIFAVRTMRPGGILRRHDVAIDASFRIVRQI